MTTNEPPPYPGEPNPSADEPSPPPNYGSAPPPPPPPGGYPPPPPGGYPPAPGGQGAVPASNKKALWSMITGIISLFCCGVVLGPVAIVLSNQARNEISESRGWQTGEGQAKAGLILGIIGIVGWVIILVIRIAALSS